MSGPSLVPLGFGKYARADRIYALQPIEGEDRGPGRRTLVWVEGIGEPLVASRSEGAIVGDLGGGAEAVAAGLAQDALDLARDLVREVRGVGPLVRRQLRAEAGLDLDAIEGRARALLERGGADDPGAPTLF